MKSFFKRFLQRFLQTFNPLFCEIRYHLQISCLIISKFKWINSITLEIVRKPLVFWWFQGEWKFINSLNIRSKIWRRCLTCIVALCAEELRLILSHWKMIYSCTENDFCNRPSCFKKTSVRGSVYIGGNPFSTNVPFM